MSLAHEEGVIARGHRSPRDLEPDIDKLHQVIPANIQVMLGAGIEDGAAY